MNFLWPQEEGGEIESRTHESTAGKQSSVADLAFEQAVGFTAGGHYHHVHCHDDDDHHEPCARQSNSQVRDYKNIYKK